jgi:hypothetical protein
MSDQIVIEVDVSDLKPMPVDPPDYVAILQNMRHVLRGVQVAVRNRMVPDAKIEKIYSGCIEGLVESLDKLLPMTENELEIVLYAIQLQRAVLGR